MSITPSEARELRAKVDQAGQDIQSINIKLGYFKDSDEAFRAALVKLTATVDALAAEVQALKNAGHAPAAKTAKKG